MFGVLIGGVKPWFHLLFYIEMFRTLLYTEVYLFKSHSICKKEYIQPYHNVVQF